MPCFNLERVVRTQKTEIGIDASFAEEFGGGNAKMARDDLAARH
jgi:hypothetical protein